MSEVKAGIDPLVWRVQSRAGGPGRRAPFARPGARRRRRAFDAPPGAHDLCRPHARHAGGGHQPDHRRTGPAPHRRGTARAGPLRLARDERAPAADGGPLTPRQVRMIFAGLMLGMLVAAINLTTVAPALPRIVAELGGLEHYGWVAMSATLTSAVVVPAIGKLGDLFGRKPFYVAGLVLFMIASVLSGTAQTFWWLVGARVIQGIAMGMLMPLSQAIIGDIVAPRERGKYQGLMGMAFGVASVSGPPLGGWITQQFSWRWLFFFNLPVGLVALWFIVRHM